MTSALGLGECQWLRVRDPEQYCSDGAKAGLLMANGFEGRPGAAQVHRLLQHLRVHACRADRLGCRQPLCQYPHEIRV